MDADHPVRSHGVGEALDGNSFLSLGQDRILDEACRFVSNQYSAELSTGLQPCGQIHLVANDRVIHSVRAAEIADGTEARVGPNAQLEWLF